MSKKTILVAEDNSVNRMLLKRILSDEYDVIEVADGEQAFKMITEMNDDLSAVVLDLGMPGMNGEEILLRLNDNARYSNLPVIVATGSSDAETERRCLSLGAWDFITKPYDAEKLLIRLRNIIGRSENHLLEKLRSVAMYDSLTGIFNRDYFMYCTHAMIRDNPGVTFVMIRMDINRFRLFNASYGKLAGNELLIKFARSVKKIVSPRKLTTYGRIESDVFCVCTPYDREDIIDEMISGAERIHSISRSYRLEMSFGAYVIDEPELDIEEIYSRASEAAKLCKADYNQPYAFYGEELHKKLLMEQKILNELEDALSGRQFLVYLQPKHSLAQNCTCGAEALVRWEHPEKGLIPPSDFIPILEKNGLIVRLDNYMLESVCGLISRWEREEKPLMPISVNVSRVSLYNPGIVSALEEMTDRYGIDRALLHLEITESAYMSNPELMLDIIKRLRKSGFLILVDDFGSGYSSLNTLKDIEVDILKIDMKFLSVGGNNSRSEKILASIIRMAGWIGMPVIMEGVETKTQSDFLVSIGCGYAQGYYFAKPMTVDTFEKHIAPEKLPEPRSEDRAGPDNSEIDVLWAADGRTAALLESISVPYAIIDYAQKKIGILRMNAAFLDAFEGESGCLDALGPDGQNRLLLAAETAIKQRGEGESDCECLCVVGNGVFKWYHIHLQLIKSFAESSLFGATFTDVTSERVLEKELNNIINAFRMPEGGQTKMLIIDDSELSREILRSIFEEEYEILTAENGQEGLKMLAEHCDGIAVILLDMVMPVMDGRQFLARKNSSAGTANIPVIVISADNSEDLQVNMIQSGVNDYITKPFIPQAVRRRVKNVIEYNTRFRSLVRQYNASSVSEVKLRALARRSEYTQEDVMGMLDFLAHIFDVKRLVDPKRAVLLGFDREGNIVSEPYSCFRIWEKEARCANCSGLCALQGHCALSKYELIESDVFYVVSQPITVILANGERLECVIEVASHLSDKMTIGTVNASVRDLLETTQKKIYTDSLTSAYNRRYYDEMQFFQGGGERKLGLVVLDMCQFKQINDIYGHTEGDRILKAVVSTLQEQVRNTDAVIRYGGDEFVVIMTGCDEAQLASAVKRFSKAIENIKIGPNGEIPAKAIFGYAYTGSFERSGDLLMSLFKEADRMMYARKEERKRLLAQEKC